MLWNYKIPINKAVLPRASFWFGLTFFDEINAFKILKVPFEAAWKENKLFNGVLLSFKKKKKNSDEIHSSIHYLVKMVSHIYYSSYLNYHQLWAILEQYQVYRNQPLKKGKKYGSNRRSNVCKIPKTNASSPFSVELTFTPPLIASFANVKFPFLQPYNYKKFDS